VLKGEPDWTALPSKLSPAVRGLVQGCLLKDRRARIGDLSTARFLLNQPQTAASDALVTPRARSVWKRTLPIVVGLVFGAAIAAAVLVNLKPAPTVAVTRFVITLPPGQQLTVPRQAIDISRDGTRIVYVAEGRLYLRSMSEVDARAIPGADPAVNPVFSPDGQSVAFWADGALKRIAISGGTPITICPIGAAPSGIVWDDDAILFGQTGTGIMRVSPNGGNPQVVVALNPSEALGHGPQLLPGGGTLLFTLARRVEGANPWENAQIVVQSLKTGERKTIVERGADARYVPTGHLVYAVSGTLFAVPFDLAKLAATGGAVPILEGVSRVTAVNSAGAHLAFSHSGSLVYLAGPVSAAQLNLMLFDRKGGAEALALPPGSYMYPRVSPDGKRVVFETSDRKETNVSIFELSGASSVRRLTFGGNNRYPIWSADGRHIAFQSDRDGALSIFRQAADGGIAERLTTPDPGSAHFPESWSPNGDMFLFSVKKGSVWSLWSFSMRDRKATPFGDVRSTAFPTDAVFSPDGRWVAYQIGEPGAAEATTYVEPFPQTGAKYQVARGGRPQWSRDSTELFYVPAPSQFMAVTVRTQSSMTFANPVRVPRGFGMADPANARPYDITPDGRILGVGTGQTASGSPGPAQIQVVLNWFAELKSRAPTKSPVLR
jgi:serine/threonine-protein kinase